MESSNFTETALLVKKKTKPKPQQTPKQTNDLMLVFRNTSIPASLQRRAPPACCDQGTRPQRPPCSGQHSTSTNPPLGAGSCSSPRSLPPCFRFFPPLLLLPARFISQPASSLPTRSLCRQPQKSWCQPQMGFSPGTLTFNYKQQACRVLLKKSKTGKISNFSIRFPCFFSTWRGGVRLL